MKQLYIALSLCVTISCSGMQDASLNAINARELTSFFEALIIDKGWVDQSRGLFVFPDYADAKKEYVYSASAIKALMGKIEGVIERGLSNKQEKLLAKSIEKFNTCPESLTQKDLMQIQIARFANFFINKHDEFERKRLHDIIEERRKI